MSMWDGSELERRTAARVAATGFIPATNVKHSSTQSEFDVYAFLPQEGGFRRLMVQCTTASVHADKLSALKAYADSFHADDAVFVTGKKPHETLDRLAQFHGVHLLSEHTDATTSSCSIADRRLDVQAELTDREEAICAFLRGIAWLHRVALEHRDDSVWAEKVVETWNALDEVFLIPDPFQRLQRLYDIHTDEPELARKCAAAERLADTPYNALFRAMVHGDGTYSQSALAVQTLNRTHTLITFAECACAAAEGAAIPGYLDDPRGRRGPLIRSLADRDSRMAFATAAFEFIYGWGGLWSADGHSIAPELAALAGVSVADIRDARRRIDTLLRDAGMNEFIKSFDPDYGSWECFALLPYFSKGIGVHRFALGGAALDWPFSAWRDAAREHAECCREYETSH